MNKKINQSLQTQIKILDAAAILFSTYGYEKTTTRMISNAVEMSTGSIFVHFKSKGEMLTKILIQEIDLAISKGFSSAKKQTSLDDKLCVIFKSIFDFYFQNVEFSVELLKRSIFEGDELLKEQVLSFNIQIMKLVLSAQESEEVLDSKDPEIIIKVLFSVYFNVLLKHLVYEENSNAKRALNELRSSFDIIL